MLSNTELMSTSKPKISIVTVCLNAEKTIRQTIESVVNQSFEGYEFIVIDGGSSDSTVSIIQEYQLHINHWVSEQDNGIADAMNKGAGFANGRLLYFLQADDYLAGPEVLAAVWSYADELADLIGGTVTLLGASENKQLRSRGFTWWSNFKMAGPHQAIFCKRDLFLKLNGFDASFQVAMDFDFLLRAKSQGARYLVIDTNVAVMGDDGISNQKDWRNLRLRLAEEQKSHYQVQGLKRQILYRVYWALYWPFRIFKHQISSK